MHYGQYDTDARAKKTSDHPHAMRVAVVDLDQGDTAWNPGSTKGDIHGPAKVTYSQHVDGSYNYTIDRKVEGAPPEQHVTLGESENHYLKADAGSIFDPEGYQIRHFLRDEDDEENGGTLIFARAEAVTFAKFVLAHEEARK